MFMITLASMVFTLIILILTFVLNIITNTPPLTVKTPDLLNVGLTQKSLAPLPFSLHFFLIAIIFIIFDVEVTLFLPMMIIMKSTNTL